MVNHPTCYNINHISAKRNGTLWAPSALSKRHTRHSIATIRRNPLHRGHPNRNKYLDVLQRTHEFLRSRRCNSRSRPGFPILPCKHPVEWRLDGFQPILAENTGLKCGTHMEINVHAKQPISQVYGGRLTRQARTCYGRCTKTSNFVGDNAVDNTLFRCVSECHQAAVVHIDTYFQP